MSLKTLRERTRMAAVDALLPDTVFTEHDDLGTQDDQAVRQLDRVLERPASERTAVESEVEDDPQARLASIRAGPAASSGPEQFLGSPKKAGAASKGYFDHWIGVLDKAQHAPDARQSAILLRSALKDANDERSQPLALNGSDKLILERAGCDGLPYRAVAHWLRLRRYSGDSVAPLSAKQLSYWSPWLRFAPDQASARWTKQLEQANHRAGGAALSPSQLALITEHPEWSAGWVRCEAIRQTLTSPSTSVRTDRDEADSTRVDAPFNQAGATTPPPLSPSPFQAVKPAYRTSQGAHWTLADRLGSTLVAPLFFGLRVSRAFLAHSQQQLQHYRQHLPEQLVQECESALQRLEHRAQELQSLSQGTSQQTASDAAYTDYDRLVDAWTRCARWHARKQHNAWQPSDGQVRRLRQCCQAIPHDGRFAQSLTEHAEQLLQALQRLVERLHAPAQVHRAASAPSA